MMDYTKAINKEQPLYSYHAFLFPFEWSYEGMKTELLEDQTDLGRLEAVMGQQSDRWARGDSWAKPTSLVQYNEAAYFYDFVRPVLYDSVDENTLQLYYSLRKNALTRREYVIDAGNGQEYRLEVDDITISYYNTGVGIVSFHLLNRRPDQSSPQAILKINALGRRVFPPFLATDTELLGQQAFFDDDNWLRGLNDVKSYDEIPRSITIMENGTPISTEDYLSWTVRQKLDREPNLIHELLPAPIFSTINMRPVLDDRMFVVCYYGNTELANELRGAEVEKEGNKSYPEADEIYQSHSWWYEYVFVDGKGKTVQSPAMMAKLLKETMNPRWNGYGTFYGVSRYSFVCLTEAMSDNGFSKILCSHVQTMYFKLALLGLVQRASLLRFSEEVTNISNLEKPDKHIAKRIGSLNKQYIRFINRVYFREVTAQDQGIELYGILQKQMQLGKQVAALDQEIQELHQYVLILEEDARNESLDLLTYFAALFIVPGFIAGYFGINGFNMEAYWWAVSLICISSSALAIAVIRANKKWRVLWLIIIALFTAFVIGVFPKMVGAFG